MAEEHSYTNRQLSERFEADEKINLLDIVSTIRRRWAWFGLTFTVVLGGVIAGTLLQTPIFQATGRLLIKSDTQASDLLGLAEKFGALDAASSQSNPVETEIQVLLSPPLLQTVIDDLDLRDADNLPLDVEEFGEELEAN
ncbi:MAG: Wzz/FepE/Etk N-terminal domain-containing protein [Cyanobacteria bacterium P01_F01_bin.42]